MLLLHGTLPEFDFSSHSYYNHSKNAAENEYTYQIMILTVLINTNPQESICFKTENENGKTMHFQ